MSGQTSYTEFQPASVAGMQVDLTDSTIQSLAANESISFGRAVAYESQDKARLCAAAGDITSGTFAGFAVFDSSKVNQTGYLQYEVVNVMRQGVIYVESLEATTIGGAVYIQHASGANRGKVAANSGANVALLPNAKFMQTIGAAGLVAISFNAAV